MKPDFIYARNYINR